MYAVIRSGGKQYRVEHGGQLEVERLDAPEGAELTLEPVLVVDGETVMATPSALDDAAVAVRVLGTAKGPKINGFTYKPKTNNRRRWGHRQGYTVIEVTSITAAGKTSTPPEGDRADDAGPERARGSAEQGTAAKPAKKPAAKKSAAKKSAAKKPAAKKPAAKREASDAASTRATKSPRKKGER